MAAMFGSTCFSHGIFHSDRCRYCHLKVFSQAASCRCYSIIRLRDAYVYLPPSSLIENVQMLAGSPMPCRPAYRPCGLEHGLRAYRVPSHFSFRHASPCSRSPRHGAPLRPPVRPAFHTPLRCVRLDAFACRCNWIYHLSARQPPFRFSGRTSAAGTRSIVQKWASPKGQRAGNARVRHRS
jgi:hypothetical protein